MSNLVTCDLQGLTPEVLLKTVTVVDNGVYYINGEITALETFETLDCEDNLTAADILRLLVTADGKIRMATI